MEWPFVNWNISSPASRRRDEQFLLDLADRRLHRRLAGVHPSARAVDLPRAEPLLLVDQQDFAVLDDKEERSALDGLPTSPVDVGETGHLHESATTKHTKNTKGRAETVFSVFVCFVSFVPRR
jgi:hypothetical protein